MKEKVEDDKTTTLNEDINISQKVADNSETIGDEKINKELEEQEKVNNVKDEETQIKEFIQKRLKEKIRESEFWSEEQLSKISNIEENQTKMISDYIYDMGKDRLANKDKDDKSKKYYNKLKKKCINIVEYETLVNPNFDIKAAIQKEKEIKNKLEAGEITPEQALKAYSEPISEHGSGMISSLQKYGIKTYENIYKEITLKKENENKSKLFRESLAKDAPTLEEQAKKSRVFQEKEHSRDDNDIKVKTLDNLSK